MDLPGRPRATNAWLLAPTDDGILRSSIFPGPWLDRAALLCDDFGTLLEVLQRSLDTPERAAFKTELQRAKLEPAC